MRNLSTNTQTSTNFYLKWIEYKILLANKLITNSVIRNTFIQFWNEKIKGNLQTNQFVIIQLKAQLSDGTYRTLSNAQIVKLTDFISVLESFYIFWEIKGEEYYLTEIDSIIFSYKFIPLQSSINESKISLPKEIKTKNKPTFKFIGYNLPSTMDLTEWGTYHFTNDYTKATVYKSNSKASYHIFLYKNYQIVELKYKDALLLKFTDIMTDHNNLSSFIRKFDTQEYIFENSKIIVKKIERKSVFLKTILQHQFKNNKFITMDLETRCLNNVMIPYTVSIFDGSDKFSFYLSDYNNSDEMLQKAIEYLLKRKYHNYKVYLHNFSNFDSVFIIKILSSLSNKIKPIIREGKLIDLKFSFGSDNYSLFFRDSYLMLPSALKKLAENFNVENKGIFPYKFVNESGISLDYDGKVPAYKYFTDLSIEEYIKYCNQFKYSNWNLKKETIKYCEQDCISLYQVIDKFALKIYELFRIDLFKYSTLPSLAFAIYRSNYLNKNTKIPLIMGEIYDFIKKGYTGGSVDVIKSYGKNIYRYDVNSLYPYVMKTFPMPVGNPIFFEGDISLVENKPFGIFEVEVTAPKNLNIPILQTKVDTGNGLRTISPLGTWTGVYFSEELNNALNYGYKFKIIRGYLFKKENIFTEYVDFLYNLKVNSVKDSPDYLISKLLLNSLYGRFGMNPTKEEHIIVEMEQALNIYKKYEITNIVDLNNGKELITFFDENIYLDNKRATNNSIPISMAVTAWARIHMTQFKNNADYELFYTDTDSIDINKPLPTSHVGKKLGQMKLEHIFDKAIFLAPKVYGGITPNYEYIRIKGLKNPITYQELEPLLFKNKYFKINQEKWYKDISKGNITIKNEVYTLMITDNKRKLIFDNNNKFINTTPLILDKEKN